METLKTKTQNKHDAQKGLAFATGVFGCDAGTEQVSKAQEIVLKRKAENKLKIELLKSQLFNNLSGMLVSFEEIGDSIQVELCASKDVNFQTILNEIVSEDRLHEFEANQEIGEDGVPL